MDPNVQKPWEDFLNSEILRARLISASIYEDGTRSGRVMALQLLCDIALGDEEKSRFYDEEFRKRIGRDKPAGPVGEATHD